MTMQRSNRIRSTHQRRVLDWLADGGGTVTEVARALSIRVPHASAALKKLRESGDVVRDDVNLRGSRYRLSSQGLSRLEADGIARLTDLVQWPPPPGAAGIVLSREGSLMLLGYVSQPSGPLLGLPERPMDEESGVLISSNGNTGEAESWRWAVQRGDGPVWWDIESMRRANPPERSSPMTLTAWMERPKIIGLVRARLLDDTIPWPVGVGSWFTSLPSGFWPELPQVLRDGESQVGRAGNTGPVVKPQGGIHAILGRRIDRSVVASNMAEKCISVVDGELLGHPPQHLPFDILRFWLRLVHPRLSDFAIKDRYERLVNDIKSNSSNSMTRKVLSDFPGRGWCEDFGTIIDTRNISQRGGEATLLAVLELSKAPIILDWRWKHVPVLDRLAVNNRCRLVISDSMDLDLPFRLTATGTVGKYDLEMQGRMKIPITISQDIKMPIGWQAPICPEDLIRGNSRIVKNADNETEALWLAIQLSHGDDAWADRHESEYPLASWIATTPQNHSSRWRRIGGKLDTAWSNLADLTKFDDEDLAELAMNEDTALSILVDRLRRIPLSNLSRNPTKPSVATAILLSREWFEEIPDVIDLWLQAPLRASDVLRKNWHEPEIGKLVNACKQHKMLLQDSVVDRDKMLAIMEDVHFSIWKDKAHSWLTTCLSSTMGRSALSMLELPWPVILSSQEIKADDLALVHHMPDGIGKNYLLDSLEGLTAAEQGVNPPISRSHPFAGWLFKEKVPLVPLETTYDMEIHIELHRRFQQG